MFVHAILSFFISVNYHCHPYCIPQQISQIAAKYIQPGQIVTQTIALYYKTFFQISYVSTFIIQNTLCMTRDVSLDFTRFSYTSFIRSLRPRIHLQYNMLVHISDISVSFITCSMYNIYIYMYIICVKVLGHLFDAFVHIPFRKFQIYDEDINIRDYFCVNAFCSLSGTWDQRPSNQCYACT